MRLSGRFESSPFFAVFRYSENTIALQDIFLDPCFLHFHTFEGQVEFFMINNHFLKNERDLDDPISLFLKIR